MNRVTAKAPPLPEREEVKVANVEVISCAAKGRRNDIYVLQKQ